MRSAIRLSVILLLVTSCNNVYREYDKKSFPTYSWKSGQEVTFNPRIEDTTKSYKVRAGFRHIYGFPLDTIAIVIKRTSPSGKEESKKYQIAVRKSKTEYVGSCGGDLCDLESVVETNVKFEEAGEYKFVITHNVSLNSVPGIMEVGLIIDEM